MNYYQLVPPIFSLLLTFLGIKLMLRFFPKWGLLDRPHKYGLKRPSIPYSGGIVFFFVFLVSTFLFVDITKPIAGVIFAGILIVFISFIDDRIKISPWIRLLVQVLAGIIVVLAGIKIQVIKNPFVYDLGIRLDTFEFSFLGQNIWLLSALFIIAWLILMMNVMNWLDGIPGLASGISGIAQLSIFILATRQFHIVDQGAVITISSVLAAGALVFLLFDFPPPKILMGDTGSMFLGFMLGSLSILAGGKLATALLIMGFPVLDAFWVILKRILQGKSPLHGDYSHFHHRLLRIGLSERTSLFFNYFICSVFAGIALLLTATFEKFVAFIGVFIAMFLISFVLFLYK